MFQTLANQLGRSLPSLTAQGARSCAINYGYHTQPYGFAEVAKVAYEHTVEAEVARVYTTRENASGVYLLIRAVDPVKAEAYWAAHKKGRKRRAADILNSVSIQRSTSLAILKAARTGKNGHVPKKIQPRSLVTKQEQRAIQKRQKALVGFAKAGWYQAARALGRVRSTVVADDGSRTSAQIFPAYIRTLARRNSGIGSGKTVSSPHHAMTSISTHVRHALPALPESARKKAEESARQAFQKACREAMAAIVRNRHKAA